MNMISNEVGEEETRERGDLLKLEMEIPFDQGMQKLEVLEKRRWNHRFVKL